MVKLDLLVEDCPAINTAFMTANLARIRERQEISDILRLDIGDGGVELAYWAEYSGEDTYLGIALPNQEPQQVLLDHCSAHIGSRTYLVCECGNRVRKLYLPLGKGLFRCRKCYGLRYALTAINRGSAHGELLYRLNRASKLMETAEGKRVFYRGRLTKKVAGLIKLRQKAGLGDMTENVGLALAAIRG